LRVDIPVMMTEHPELPRNPVRAQIDEQAQIRAEIAHEHLMARICAGHRLQGERAGFGRRIGLVSRRSVGLGGSKSLWQPGDRAW
jgi:hypothetical protein